MTAREYRQFCPVARALDLVGERWTLMIVRDLLLGPRRFTDLQSGLPGLGASLLTQRLQQMESLDLIARRRLPPPAPATVYELTAAGRGLAPVVRDLAQWGSAYLDSPADETLRPEHLALYLAEITDPSGLAGIEATVEFRVDGGHAHLLIGDGRVVARSGAAATPPDAILTAGAAAYAELTLGRTGLDTLTTDGAISRTENSAGRAALRALFPSQQGESS